MMKVYQLTWMVVYTTMDILLIPVIPLQNLNNSRWIIVIANHIQLNEDVQASQSF
jgi:hypothetical protein